MEDRYQMEIPADHVIMPWTVRHAAWTYNRFSVNARGCSPYEELRKKRYDHHVVGLAEKAMWQRVGDGAAEARLEERWLPGIWC